MLIAVGDWKRPHNHVEMFSFTDSIWQAKNDYPYSEDIFGYSILTVEKKFIIIGGYSKERKVLSQYY